jgi:hypothetical protein
MNQLVVGLGSLQPRNVMFGERSFEGVCVHHLRCAASHADRAPIN